MDDTDLKIVIIDYQMSNLFSVKHACDYFGVDAEFTSDKDKILNADGAILPGVGAFSSAMKNLQSLDLVLPIRDFVEMGKPLMGICLGLQLLFTESKEFGNTTGMDIIPGTVVKFDKNANEERKIKVPHMGWSEVYQPTGNHNGGWENSPLCGVADKEYMYFVHSYFVVPDDDRDILAKSNYEGMEFCSAIKKKNIFATQFHPEKSAKQGVEIYSNWFQSIKN